MKVRHCGSALLAAGLVSGSLFLFSGPAHATSAAGVAGSQLTINAEAGKANRFRLGSVNTTISVVDTGDFIQAGNGCVQINRNTIECDATNVIRILVNTNDGDDTVESLVPLETTVNAGAGNDQVTTSARDDSLSGGPGNDILNGGAGADTINGGADADALNGGAGRDTLDGGAGPDVYNGGADDDTADYESRTANLNVSLNDIADDGAAGEGDNVRSDVENVETGSGADVLTGSSVTTVMNRLVGNGGSDTLSGLAGRDILVGGDGGDSLSGGEGNDDFFPGRNGDAISGGAGGDEVFYNDRTVRVVVTLDGLANDGETGELDNVGTDVEDITGGAGADSLTGNNVRNVLIGGGGPDFLAGNGGDDFLGGESGIDTLNGGNEADVLSGGPDSDTLNGGRGADTLRGDDGDDTLSGGELGAGNDGADRFDGGFGNDTVDYSDHGGVPVAASLDSVANDGAIGQNEGDDIDFGVENIIGGSGPDVLTGDNNANRLVGGKFATDGGDLLFGLGGDDTLLGGFGNDTLNCGANIDLGDGGPGTGDAVQIGHGCETLLNVP